jgi:hypothetical protein
MYIRVGVSDNRQHSHQSERSHGNLGWFFNRIVVGSFNPTILTSFKHLALFQHHGETTMTSASMPRTIIERSHTRSPSSPQPFASEASQDMGSAIADGSGANPCRRAHEPVWNRLGWGAPPSYIQQIRADASPLFWGHQTTTPTHPSSKREIYSTTLPYHTRMALSAIMASLDAARMHHPCPRLSRQVPRPPAMSAQVASSSLPKVSLLFFLLRRTS